MKIYLIDAGDFSCTQGVATIVHHYFGLKSRLSYVWLYYIALLVWGNMKHTLILYYLNIRFLVRSLSPEAINPGSMLPIIRNQSNLTS